MSKRRRRRSSNRAARYLSLMLRGEEKLNRLYARTRDQGKKLPPADQGRKLEPYVGEDV